MLQDQLFVIPALVRARSFGFQFDLQFPINMQFNNNKKKQTSTKLAGSFWILMKLLKTTKNVQLTFPEIISVLLKCLPRPRSGVLHVPLVLAAWKTHEI